MKIGFILPINGISGGLFVIYRHANYLCSRGHEVTCIFSSELYGKKIVSTKEVNFHTAYLSEIVHSGEQFDIIFASWWKTYYEMYRVSSRHYAYFCQSDERRFYSSARAAEIRQVTFTYERPETEIICIARWMNLWLKREFGRSSHIVPNGIDTSLFHPHVKPIAPRGEKFRVLIEGAGSIAFKKLDLAFEVTNRFPDVEVWLASADGVVKPHWRYDRIFSRLALEAMPAIYASCHVLLKLSVVESFAYPPLEIMACGGVPIIGEVTGIEEYARHERNCLIVPANDAVGAAAALKRLSTDKALWNRLSKNAAETGRSLDWKTRLPLFESIVKKILRKKPGNEGQFTPQLADFFFREAEEQNQLLRASFAYRFGYHTTKAPRALYRKIRQLRAVNAVRRWFSGFLKET